MHATPPANTRTHAKPNPNQEKEVATYVPTHADMSNLKSNFTC